MTPSPERDPRPWFEQAEEDLDAGEAMLVAGFPAHAAFNAQQAAEKALKGLQLRRGGAFQRTHDLLLLARQLKAEARIEALAAALSHYYTESRYPDMPAEVSEGEAREALAGAKEVVRWAQTQPS